MRQVTFYPGRYAIEKGSILPVGDPTQYISNEEVSDCSCCVPSGEARAAPLAHGVGHICKSKMS